MHTAFTYKKWDLQHQDEVNDIASLGSSPTYSQSPLLDPSTTIFTLSNLFSKTATSRYISVGSYPMFAYYITTESTWPLKSATSMVSYVVSFAKSWWGSSTSQTSQNSSATPYVPDLRHPPRHIELAAPIPAIFSSNDSYHKINRVSLCPPSTSAQRHTLAATTDTLGRVILWDTLQGEMIRMWKGVRDAVCGRIEVFEHKLYNTTAVATLCILQFLAIYSSKHEVLKIFQMRHSDNMFSLSALLRTYTKWDYIY
ncbi:hypothetical protein G6F56_001178 [Rhizopus delemar]|uniref:Rab3 GTPase-activating protein non-catalytic subunit n=1 Tax=Rhizopus stolonifer TaxID=4846 RepID=A0A367JJM3_RHIST|nr:hypothetical protein G6F56_001178 [Rhizopus delemar]RCH89901.1 Rab3 GTPase-activating protein non-catalytic subunit [Rhizopus stolonifer]